MYKKFEIELALSYQDTFELLNESGQDVSDWVLVDSSSEAGIIEWKQIFWSAYGFAKIKVELEKIDTNNTLAKVTIFRPIQIWDPAKLCDKVFKKLKNKVIRKMGKEI